MPSNSAFTLTELIAMLRESAGEEEGVNLDGDVQDTSFAELGYDSLALLQILGRLQRERGVSIPDEAIADAETPRDLLALVNNTAAVASA